MSNEQITRRYEDQAEERTVTGWVCKTCNRWYGYGDDGKHMASYCCCTDRPCECGGRAEKSYIKCPACREKADTERYHAREERDWDGETPLCCDNDDRWFFSMDELLDHLETDTPTVEQIEALRLRIGVPHHPHYFDLSEWLEDHLSDDQDIPGDWETAEKAVNDYLASVKPLSWTHGKYRPTMASILANVQAKEAQP